VNVAVGHWDYWMNHGQPMRGQENLNDYIFAVKTNPAMAAYGYFADKHLVKSLIGTMLGEEYVIPSLYVSATGDGLENFYSAERYIVKPTHSCHQVIITKGSLTSAQVTRAKHWLKSTLFQFTREYTYRCLEPKIIIEPLITYRGDVPPDFKFFMARGRCFLIQIDGQRFGDRPTRDFYTSDWEKLDLLMREEAGAPIPAPAELPEMLRISEKLGSMFDFARIDLYLSDHGIKFGEITLTPGAGHYTFDKQSVQESLYQEMRRLQSVQ
jgi:hypothetical protein